MNQTLLVECDKCIKELDEVKNDWKKHALITLTIAAVIMTGGVKEVIKSKLKPGSPEYQQQNFGNKQVTKGRDGIILTVTFEESYDMIIPTVSA